ncbi:MAG: ComEC/Rec2 family competence protein [Bacteroidota bacterium]|nr:ComEC/Rec2 family competence protein [Bacteroidota bacterium]
MGILTFIYANNIIQIPIIVFFCFTVVYIIFLLLKNRNPSLFRSILGINGAIILYCYGYIVTQYAYAPNSPNHISNYSTNVSSYIGIINSQPEEKDNTFKCELEVQSIKTGNHWKPANGKVLVYFSKKDLSKMPLYGTQIAIKGNPDTVTTPQNPGEFDLKKYYSYQQIYHRDFVTNKDFIKVGQTTPNYTLALAIYLRERVQEIFQKYIPGRIEGNIAAALILGIKSTLDYQIQHAYSATGTMHVLAVSGMHVGIIYKLLEFLLLFLKKGKIGKSIHYSLLFLFLWLYAFVTGLCPSVLRAVTMFSFIIISNVFNRKTNIYNTLGLSAFVLLCFDPYMITEVGFQLSYLAVGGIVFFYDRIYQIYTTENKIIDLAWQVTSISIAAQLVTFPLGLLYFHQFPNYFILSNLVVIPIATGIMYVGLLFLSFSWIDLVAEWLGWLIEKSVLVLNFIIFKMEELPFATFHDIYFTVFETWLTYGIIFCFTMIIGLKKGNYVYLLVPLTLVLLFNITYRIIENKNQSSICIYQINKSTAIDLMSGQNVYFYSSLNLINNPSKIQFHISNNRARKGVSVHESKKLDSTSSVQSIKFNGKKIIIINHKIEDNILPKSDFILITNNAFVQDECLKNNSKSTIIFDGSNKTFKVLNQIKYLKSKGFEVYDTFRNGAFTVTL